MQRKLSSAALLSLLVLVFVLVVPSAQTADLQLFRVKVEDLHPTQMAVGDIEVKEKMRKLKDFKDDQNKLDEYLRSDGKPEPVVLGPGNMRYIIDHHHLAAALHRTGIKHCYFTLEADLSRLSEKEFWQTMNGEIPYKGEKRHWVYPYDEKGKGPYPYSRLPATVDGLKNDPYRSLAGKVRKPGGGYTKSPVPFAEFVWANWFRDKVKINDNESNFDKAVEEAIKLSHSQEAHDAKLPGFSWTKVEN